VVVLELVIARLVLYTRRHIPMKFWYALPVVLTLFVVCTLQSRWFPGCRRLSSRLAVRSGQIIGNCMLPLFFFFILTPLAWAWRLVGIDLLRLKHPRNASSYWQQAKNSSPLKRPY
jgi:hypothetical protein